MRDFVARLCRLHRECTFQILNKECPGIFAKVGVDVIDETISVFPHLTREKVPCDWIAIGFRGHDFWKVHMGIPFSIEGGEAGFPTEKGTATFRTGWHINSEYYMTKLSGEPIKSFEYNGMKLERGDIPAGEQHFQLPPVSITLENAGTGFQIFLDQGLALYRYMYKKLQNVRPD
jgi:hypothetical protein